jgi:glucosamine kinase
MTSVGPLGLGIDTGGTQTRWALAESNGNVVASGSVAGASAMQISDAAGRATLERVFTDLGAAVTPYGRPTRVVAGLTGFAGYADAAAPALKALLQPALGVEAAAIELLGDVELAYLGAFAPGEGFLIYAGTGSIAVFISREGNLSRAGGRGGLLDDGGSGFWIAREAFRRIWRDEDMSPGSWRDSPLASRLFATIGGSDWLTTRSFVYTKSRGEVGKIALLVAETAAQDVRSTQILMDAGNELARLSNVMTKRFGRKPTALAGRVIGLHSLIEQSFRASLSYRCKVSVFTGEAHLTAARLAATGFARAPSWAIVAQGSHPVICSDESDEAHERSGR